MEEDSKIDKIMEQIPCIYRINYSMLFKQDNNFIIYVKKEDVPIPIYCGDIIRTNNSDYKIINFGNEKISNYECLVTKKIDLIKNPKEYEKRKII